nr:TetR/AcrR family transcriptional regulator [uncultured Blautia sp.]
MGKLELNKKKKEDALYNTAFELFTTKGPNKTTISDIVERAGVAKGTFYLYFKDKYDIRNKLASHKTKDLFYAAYQAVIENHITGFPAQLHFMIDHILENLKNDSQLLIFVSKNLSWGVFQAALEDQMPDADCKFYDMYLQLIAQDSRTYEHPDLLLFSVIELASSTCYNCILYQQPVPLEEYMPYLHKSIDGILASYTTASAN